MKKNLIIAILAGMLLYRGYDDYKQQKFIEAAYGEYHQTMAEIDRQEAAIAETQKEVDAQAATLAKLP